MSGDHTSSPTWLPVLETERLIIRPFSLDDLEAKLALDRSLGYGAEPKTQQRWLQWSALNYEQLANLRQPPYGDRAIVVKENGALAGSVGLVPSLGPFDRLPSFRCLLANPGEPLYRPEVGLYWALDPAYRGRGYATEAAGTLIDQSFHRLGLQRIVATTEHANEASQAVMRRLGMSVERNPDPDPPWFQVVGVLWHPDITRT